MTPSRGKPRKTTVMLQTDIIEWLDTEALRRSTSRSKLVNTAVDVYRLLNGLSELASLSALAEEVSNPNARPLTRLMRKLARERWSDEFARPD